MKYATLGSISSGTMRPEDLIPCFADELGSLLNKDIQSAISAGDVRAMSDSELKEWCKWIARQSSLIGAAGSVDPDSDEASEILSELFDALEAFAPPLAYFGSHPGDGADYGFWLSESFAEDFDGLKVSDTSEVPEDFCGEVLHVNDHSNATLYAADHGKLTEIWAVV